jgi:hypothetical protein
MHWIGYDIGIVGKVGGGGGNTFVVTVYIVFCINTRKTYSITTTLAT